MECFEIINRIVIINIGMGVNYFTWNGVTFCSI